MAEWSCSSGKSPLLLSADSVDPEIAGSEKHPSCFLSEYEITIISHWECNCVCQKCVPAILLCRSDTWITHRHQERRLDTFQLRYLRTILFPGVTDFPATTSCRRPSCLICTQSRPFRWLGLVLRTDKSRLPNETLFEELGNAAISLGRSGLRCKDVLKRDLSAFQIQH